MYLELPAVAVSTPDQRLQALRDAKALMSGAEPGGFSALFSASAATPGPGREAIDGFIRLAEYITTGHEYKDTHPVGKRRPVIKQTTNVTVVAPPGIDNEDLEHFLHHVENGDFSDFLKEAMQQAKEPAEGDAEKEDEDPSPEADPDRDSDTPPPAHPWAN